MREIKFRAWDKEEKRFLDYFQISSIGTLAVWTGFNWEAGEEDRYVLMQHTGLKDKNGKEIYEGDVLKDEDGLIMECSWKERYAAFYFYGKDNYVYEFESTSGLEVIGNIYENPELVSNQINK